MKCAAWSELPRALVSSEVGDFARSSAPNALYAGSSSASWRETAAAASRASASMRDINGGSFNMHILQAQVAVEHDGVAPGPGREAPAVGGAEVVGGVGGDAARRVGQLESERVDQ